MVIAVLVFTVIISLYASVRYQMVTLGIPKYKQMKEHEGREWRYEEVILPVKIGEGVEAQVKSEVKWCPETGEIFRKKQDTGMFEKEWEEITRYSNLHKRLLRNFENKYIKNRGNQTRSPGGTNWTTIS